MTVLTTQYKVLRTLLSGEAKRPKEIAIEIDRAPQTVRDTLVRLRRLDLVERVDYGLYRISDFGREYLKKLTQPSTLQGSKESEVE